MADILLGQSDTHGTAPLTQAQTVKICRHLQTEIREVEVDTNGNKRDLQRTTEQVKNLQEEQVVIHDQVHNVQVGISDVNVGMQKLQMEVSRVFQAVQQLQLSDQHSKDKVVQLEEGRKMTDTRLDVMSKDIAHEVASGKMLRQVIEKKVNDDMRTLLKDVAGTRLQLDQLKEELAVTVQSQNEDRNSLKLAHSNIENIVNEVKKSNIVTNIVENRLASTAKGVQANWTKSAELGDSLLRLTECYDKSKSRILETEGFLKELNDTGNQTQHKVDEAIRKLDANSDKLGQALRQIAANGSNGDDLRRQVHNLAQEVTDCNRRMGSIARELSEVGDATHEVRAGLKEQSTMLLPNIHLDSQEAVTASKRHGSLLNSMTSDKMGGRQLQSVSSY